VVLSIGQGSAAATPLQCALLSAAVANGGYAVRPHLNAALDGEVPIRIWSEATNDILLAGMRKCIEKGPPAPTGTGRLAAVNGLGVIGKTGSAQIMSLAHHEQYATEEDIPKHMRDHAWFIAGVVDRDPPIAICILIEHGHHGSSEAAPVAKLLIEYFYGVGEEPAAVVAKTGSAGR
jgi:penicillin-binding protein 2